MKFEWKKVKFGDILAIPLRNGLTKPKSVRGTGCKLINMGELFANGRISTRISMDLAPVTLREFQNSHVIQGDLLFARQSLVLSGAGKCSIVLDDTDNAVFESHLIRARINESIASSEFYYYYFLSFAGKKNIESIVEQVSAAGIRSSDLAKLVVPLPPLPEQRAIAAILSCFDDKIELNNQISANLEAQAQAIFKSWFVDFEPFRNLGFVGSELGPIPKGWKVISLIENCSLIAKGITPKYDENSRELVINQKCIRDNKIDLSLARKHRSRNQNEKWLQYGDILINSTGTGTLGRVAQSFFSFDITADSHVTIVRPKNAVLIAYLGANLCEKQSIFESMASGSTGQTDLPRERLKSMLIVVPPENILKNFATYYMPYKKMIVKNQNQSNKLAALRDTLLTKLMSGEIEAPV